jgi:hypothetical protein
MGLWRADGDAALPRPHAAAPNATLLRLGSDGFVVAAGTSALGGLIRSGELQVQHAHQTWSYARTCLTLSILLCGRTAFFTPCNLSPTHGVGTRTVQALNCARGVPMSGPPRAVTTQRATGLPRAATSTKEGCWRSRPQLTSRIFNFALVSHRR